MRLLLLLIILLGFALRVYRIDSQSFWYDEGVTAQVAQLGVRELARWTADDIQPPLYYLLVGGWLRLNPFGELILRLPSAFWGALLIPLLWALGRRLWIAKARRGITKARSTKARSAKRDEGAKREGTKHEGAKREGARGWRADGRGEVAGLAAALVGATSPLMVYYGQEARMYTLLVLLVTLAALGMVRFAQGARHGLIVYALAGLAALYTHYFAGFALLALALYGGVAWRQAEPRHGRKALALLAANALILLGYVPWLPAMWGRFQADASYWAGSLKLDEALLDVAISFIAGATEVMLEADARGWLPWLGLAALLWALALLRRPRGDHRAGLLLLLWGLVPIVLILALAYRTPKFNARYLMVSWPVWALLAGGGLAALWQGGPLGRGRFGVGRLLTVVTLALMLAVHTAGLRNWYYDDNFAKSAWREAISEMYWQRQPGEIVLLVSGHAYPVFDTYLPARHGVQRERLPELDILDVNQVLGWEEAARGLNTALAGKEGVWLFLWQDEVVDPAGVVTLLLDRYAVAQPTGEFAYLGLRHYRLPAGQRFPEAPLVSGPLASFADLVRLQGMALREDGLWLYWQGQQAHLPDLQVFVTLTSPTGEILFSQDMRPVGYDFPTTRWQPGDTYPVRLAAPLDSFQGLRLRLVVYEASAGTPLGEYETALDGG